MRSGSTVPRAVAGSLVAAILVLAAGMAGAQTAPKAAPSPPPGPPAVSPEPAVTTASFGDWVLRCQRLGEGEKATRVCEVSQAIQVQGQAGPLAQLALGRVGGEAGLHLTVVVPVSVSFPSSVRVGLEEKEGRESAGMDLGWRRCIPAGCVADDVVREEALKRWRTSSEAGRLLFKDAAGREVAIPVSFRGLDPALSALARERV
ncbi:invasion associated locus B family protein [Methylobacterium nonmethylotrophicum]|uniref:Invasion protein n=1 Tax=Methylobacterium nonmethylotrophicum TaxID=1141884 RepID=A0A4Z0NUC3_9HYPH|nr:invasion associated locus B family protein [Methylobacterium nonmethylotrophicum]TGE00516.1 invasion protein [Methylobacterium nonmethylotrophicum]